MVKITSPLLPEYVLHMSMCIEDILKETEKIEKLYIQLHGWIRTFIQLLREDEVYNSLFLYSFSDSYIMIYT